MVTASRVTYSSFLTQAWNNIYVLLANNLTDPVSSTSESRKWVYSRQPDTTSQSFSGYPYIIVRPATLSYDTKSQSLDMKKRNISFLIRIEIVTSDRELNCRDGLGATQLDTISDQTLQLLNDVTNRQTLKVNGLHLSLPLPTGVVVEAVAGNLNYRRSIDQSMFTRLPVSA